MRRSALRACRILDTDPEPAFDALAQLASQLLSAPIAVISFVDIDREWFKARCGTDLTEVTRSLSLFSIADAHPEELPLIVSDTSEDESSTLVSLVGAIPHARAYASMPIRSRATSNLTTCTSAHVTVLNQDARLTISSKLRSTPHLETARSAS